ncbi:MAG: 3-hydroxyacyl-ACP dehydratase FabZ [Woeseiaceae bacterium]
MSGRGDMELEAIMALLPHRYPFLLIDRVLDSEPGVRIAALKNVTANEPFFQGHFPGRPVMPGVLIIEALAQAACTLCYLSVKQRNPRPLYYLAGVDEARFRRPVGPGDTLRMEVRVARERRGMWWFDCAASVDDVPVVTAGIICAPGGELG